MTKDERTLAFAATVRLMEKASGIVLSGVKSASDYGVERLKGAHVYLYAAMLADFVRDTRREDFLGPNIQMDDGTEKPTDAFVLDHLFDEIFKPILARGGEEFLGEVRRKADIIVAAHNQAEGVAA